MLLTIVAEADKHPYRVACIATAFTEVKAKDMLIYADKSGKSCVCKKKKELEFDTIEDVMMTKVESQ